MIRLFSFLELPDVGVITNILLIQTFLSSYYANGIESVLVGDNTNHEQNKNSTYSPSGTWGDATLATYEKGMLVTEALVAVILKDIEALRKEN